jgi:hypothetical protein
MKKIDIIYITGKKGVRVKKGVWIQNNSTRITQKQNQKLKKNIKRPLNTSNHHGHPEQSSKQTREEKPKL